MNSCTAECRGPVLKRAGPATVAVRTARPCPVGWCTSCPQTNLDPPTADIHHAEAPSAAARRSRRPAHRPAARRRQHRRRTSALHGRYRYTARAGAVIGSPFQRCRTVDDDESMATGQSRDEVRTDDRSERPLPALCGLISRLPLNELWVSDALDPRIEDLPRPRPPDAARPPQMRRPGPKIPLTPDVQHPLDAAIGDH